MSVAAQEAGSRFQILVDIMARLRGPGGCPWDRKQSFETLKKYLLEETYEVLEAIDEQNWPELAEELGDLLLQPVFLAELAAEQNHFNIADCLEAINSKLVRRHPHIFGDAKAETAEDVKLRWDEIKQQEKRSKGQAGTGSILDSVLRSAPALMEAAKISEKAAAVGFDWPNTAELLKKVQEESAELAEAQAQLGKEKIEHEMGDLFFTLVNLSRILKVDPEQALRKANSRFRQRFGYIEQRLSENGTSLETAGLEQMEQLWQEAKNLPPR